MGDAPRANRGECAMDDVGGAASAGFWRDAGVHRIPLAAYTREDLYARELERFFYRGHWCYVGLEAEIPNPGDFKRTAIG